MVVLTNMPPLLLLLDITSTPPYSESHSLGLRFFRRVSLRNSLLMNKDVNAIFAFNIIPSGSVSRIKCFDHSDSENNRPSSLDSIPPKEQREAINDVHESLIEHKTVNRERLFFGKLIAAVGMAASVTLLSFCIRRYGQGSVFGIQLFSGGSPSTCLSTSPGGFSFNAFGRKIMLPEYAPGWIYFWLLMAAGCGLFISEEALNIWVGISLARLLSLDGSWQSFADSFSRNTPYILSTVIWVYWGVCISDMIPFYLGKLFRGSRVSDEVCSKLGIGKDKAISITQIVQKYGNLVGFVERFSLGVRNPTAFLAGAMDISPQYFFAGVCCGGLITLPVQLGIGFLMRERPVFALASVATVVGLWTIFPYAVAALTAIYVYFWRWHSTGPDTGPETS